MLPFTQFCARFSAFDDNEIAKGGQKIVFSALHPMYGDVVVKVLLKVDARTMREIEIMNTHQFNAVPRLYEVEQVEFKGSDSLALVEQRIDGSSLRDIIASGKRYSLAEAVDFLTQSLVFIDEISKQKIVHRDVKPENIMLTDDGRYFFLDFGIARILDAESITETGFGGPNTPGYAAPEQFAGMKDIVDSRADLFSLGVVTYELIKGENPFRKNAQGVLGILYNTATITPTLFDLEGDDRSMFRGLVSSMMSKSIIGRPRNAEEALSWLEAAKPTFRM